MDCVPVITSVNDLVEVDEGAVKGAYKMHLMFFSSQKQEHHHVTRPISAVNAPKRMLHLGEYEIASNQDNIETSFVLQLGASSFISQGNVDFSK